MNELILSHWKLSHPLLALTLLVCLSLAGCKSKVKWQEEVKLSTGEIITIDREVEHAGGGAAWPQGQGSVPMEHLIRFRYPVQSGTLIEWRSTKVGPRGTYAELPLVLNINADKTWFIFTEHWINEACVRYEKYRLQNGAWTEPPLAEDIDIHQTNLFLAAGSNQIDGLISLAQKTKENADPGYAPDLKQVSSSKYWCMEGYNGPQPPVEPPLNCRQYPAHPACQK
jgi:hypothetical protein